ncbi:hypothetical protein HZS_1593 [Henneguya salminicola]|nr:hypothetical protein HZS_1593 [Henneguya salminicola]
MLNISDLLESKDFFHTLFEVEKQKIICFPSELLVSKSQWIKVCKYTWSLQTPEIPTNIAALMTFMVLNFEIKKKQALETTSNGHDGNKISKFEPLDLTTMFQSHNSFKDITSRNEIITQLIEKSEFFDDKIDRQFNVSIHFSILYICVICFRDLTNSSIIPIITKNWSNFLNSINNPSFNAEVSSMGVNQRNAGELIAGIPVVRRTVIFYWQPHLKEILLPLTNANNLTPEVQFFPQLCNQIRHAAAYTRMSWLRIVKHTFLNPRVQNTIGAKYPSFAHDCNNLCIKISELKSIHGENFKYFRAIIPDFTPNFRFYDYPILQLVGFELGDSFNNYFKGNCPRKDIIGDLRIKSKEIAEDIRKAFNKGYTNNKKEKNDDPFE